MISKVINPIAYIRKSFRHSSYTFPILDELNVLCEYIHIFISKKILYQDQLFWQKQSSLYSISIIVFPSDFNDCA